MVASLSNHEVVERSSAYIPASFTGEQADAAYDAWGANCGPGALAAVLNLTPDDVRPHLEGFDRKRYTNPSMMLGALRSLKVRWMKVDEGWPAYGLCRIQWGGPWMREGVPIKARYRHTHWIASRYIDAGAQLGVWIFDINAAHFGWMRVAEWTDQLAPYLIRELVARGDGTWSVTHRLEIARSDPQR